MLSGNGNLIKEFSSDLQMMSLSGASNWTFGLIASIFIGSRRKKNLQDFNGLF